MMLCRQVLDNREKTTYGRGLAAALRVLGPTPRADALGMLHALRLSEEDAAGVLAHSLELGILEASDAEVAVRSTPTARRATPRRMYVVQDTSALDELALEARVRRALADAHDAHARAVRLVDVLRYQSLRAVALLDPPANDERPRPPGRDRA